MVVDLVIMQLTKEFTFFVTIKITNESTPKSINLFPTINGTWGFCWEIALVLENQRESLSFSFVVKMITLLYHLSLCISFSFLFLGSHSHVPS